MWLYFMQMQFFYAVTMVNIQNVHGFEFMPEVSLLTSKTIIVARS